MQICHDGSIAYRACTGNIARASREREVRNASQYVTLDLVV